MKKLPKLTQKRKPDARLITMLGFVVLLVAVSYWGQTARPASVTLPVERVPLETGAPTEAPVDFAAQGAAETTPPETKSAFSVYREKLAAARADSIRALNEVAENPESDAQTVAAAMREKAALAGYAEAEACVETMLAAAGWPEALCTVREDAADVVVRAETLSEQDAAAILELAARQTGLEAARIRVTCEK